MVHIIFYNLLRSKYKVHGIKVPAGSINQMIDKVLSEIPAMKRSDFESSVVFYKGKPIHKHQFDTIIEDEEEIIITHFVGGG